MLKDNQYYFKYSLNHPEPIWDEYFYPFLESIVKKKEYKNILDLEDYISKMSSKLTNKEIKKLLGLLKCKGCEKSYFAFFLRTCDLSVAEITDQKYYDSSERINATRKALGIYKKERGTPKTDKCSLQAYNDAQTAKRRSDAGEKKVIKLSGLSMASDLSGLDNKIAKISKGSGKFKIKAIKKLFGIKFKFSKKDKVPDCIFKIKDRVFILEAKHVNGQGGAQNSSISELVSILELKEKNPKIFYIAFLDGCYTKYLTVSKSNKDGTMPEKQLYRIEKTLNKNESNYFLNTAGFVQFMKDLKK
ncbi:MAG: hypothetical protein V1804_01095 [Patescibacteria group bacterium]